MSKTISPNFLTNSRILNRAVFHAWPKNEFRFITGREKVQEFYNTAYTFLDGELSTILNRHHPATVIVEAYKQLELWSAIYHNRHKKLGIEGPSDFAPVGRYGWRYVIEKSLERLSSDFNYENLKLSSGDQEEIFTILWGLMYASELSNALQFLGTHATSVYLEFNPYLLQKHFSFKIEAEEKQFVGILESFSKKINWKKYPRFWIDNPILSASINDFLKSFYDFTLKDLEIFASTLIKELFIPTRSLILVQPYEDFIDLIEEFSPLSKVQVVSIIQLAFLNTDKNNYEIRNFLKKSQSIRMVNHCGVVLSLDKNFDSIYDEGIAEADFVQSAKMHIIISPILFAEWIEVLQVRIAFGQRPDLKLQSDARIALSNIERLYRRTIFENEIKIIFNEYGYECISIDKVSGEEISCGEIDIVAYHEEMNLLVIVECKNLAPSNDFKSCRQVYSDHFRQKNYHGKFLKKITWAREHLEDVASEFKQKKGFIISEVLHIKELFVTSSDYVARFFVGEYSITTFYDLHKILKLYEEEF